MLHKNDFRRALIQAFALSSIVVAVFAGIAAMQLDAPVFITSQNPVWYKHEDFFWSQSSDSTVFAISKNTDSRLKTNALTRTFSSTILNPDKVARRNPPRALEGMAYDEQPSRRHNTLFFVRLAGSPACFLSVRYERDSHRRDRGPLAKIVAPLDHNGSLYTASDFQINRLLVACIWLALAVSTSPAILIAKALLRQRRRRAGLCVYCSYPLVASGEICPECGHAAPKQPPPPSR